MMDWTDRHCRAFHRCLSKRALLWTEMVTADAVIHGDRQRLIGFHEAEHPVVLSKFVELHPVAAKFYQSCLVSTFEFLHLNGVLYRDLKPENVLMCADGNVKLCDFGLAAVGMTAPAAHTSASGRPVLIGTTE